MSKFLKLVSVLLLVVFSTIFVSCLQIGLGEQVDTASPTVAIKYPQTNSIIKGEFLLSGTCADDLGVESISVSIEDTKKKATLGTYDAVIDSSKGTWSIILNSKENDSYPLPDSLNYEITVTATDKSKHETTDKRAFIIDNTAPVLILSSPAKIGSESPTTYGRTLKLAGDISDDNTVSSLDLYLKQYDSSTETLSEEKHITVSNFTGMSSDNPLVVAKYYTEDEVENDSTKTTLRNNYLSIYGNVKDDDNTDEILYCRIVLTDNAKSYIASDDSGTGTGNATSLYYINNDNFANNLISEQSYSLTASKLKDIIKGEDAGYSDTELAAIKNLLATSGYYASSTTIDSAASSVISMNPDNNPTYSVSNYELSGNLQSSVYKNFTAGSTLYLSLAAGRDKKYVVPSSVSAKLYKLSSATDNDISDTAENDIIVLLNKGDWTDEAALTCDKTFVLSTTNYPQLQKLSQCYFKLVVTGMDRDSTALEPANENGYGFKLTITGNPPILETGKRADTESLENVKDSEYIKSSALKFSGSVSSETNTIKSVTYEVTVKDEDISDEASSTISTYNGSAVCGDGTFDGMEETWSFSLADNESYKEIESGKVYTYTVKIIATDDNSSTTTETRRIHVDTKVPVVEITNVSPLAGTNSTCVNGTVAIEGSISESYKSTAVLTITDGSKTETVKSGSVDSFKTTVDTTSYTDKATLTLTLTATDKAGNTSEVYTKKYTIDQSTDAPVITLSNADIALQESAKITAGKNLFSTTNSNLLGAITDDDGISSVEITYSKTADGEYTSLFKNTEIGGSTTYTITSTTGISFKNLTDGLYYVKLVVTDKAQEKTGYCNTNTDYFVVARDEGAPIFSITSTKNAYQAVGQPFTVSGKVKDSGGNIKIYSSADATYDSADTLISTIKNKTDEQDWSATIAIPSGTTQGSTLYYIAIDSYGQTSIDDFPYKVDPAAPTFTITQLGSNTTSADMPTKEKSFTSYAQKSSLFIVKGLVDDEGDSGLEDVIYYMVSSTEPAKITGGAAYDTTKGTWNKSTILRQSDGNHWTANLDFSSYDEGTSYTVYLAARDNARNISLLADNPCNKIILTPDGTAPVVGSAVADDDKITNADINNNVKITASTITEGGSGIASVVLYENGSSIGKMTTSDSGATYTYSIPAHSTYLSTGSHTFAVRATDKVGNISADKTIVIAVDTTNPTANISTVTPLTSAGYANGNVTVYATAGDETELSAISWKVVDETPETKKEGTISVGDNDKIYKSFTFALDTREITTESGTYTLTVTSTDKAGNTTTTSGTTLNIDQATDVPVITLDSPATYASGVTIGVGTNLFKSSDSLTGTITDDDGLASIVIKIDSTVTDTIVGGGAKTYALNKSLSALAEGTYTIEVTATDNALGVSKTTNSFSVGIDNGAPTLTLSADVTTTKNNIYYANGDLTITAVVKDGYKLGSLEWADTAVTPATGSVTVVQDSASQTKTITVAKPASNVKSTRTITAKDSFGRTTADTITYDFDVTPPTLTPAALTGVNTEGDLNYFNSSKTLTITGTASDGTTTSNDSGLESVYYAIVEGHYATPTEATTAGKTVTWNLTSGSATWSAKVDLIEKADGNYTVFIKAVDFVGNEKISDAIKLVADKTSPAIAVTTINGVADTSVDTYYNKDTTIVGSLTEANLKQISVSSATCSGTTKTVTVANNSGVLTLSKLTDEGVWAITLSAEDKAGNKGSYTINTTVDKTSPAPVISTTNTLAVGGKTFTSSDTSGSWFNQTSLQFIGYYKENGSGIEECSYFLNPATIPTESNVAGLTSNGTFSQASVTGDACKFNVTIANFLTDNSGLNKIYFAVKDKAGNYSISDAYVINVDQSTPTLTCSRTETLLTNCATTPKISGSCSDVGSGVASVFVKINGSEISSSVTSGTWTATSSEVASALSGLSTSSYPVTAVVTDNADNSNTFSLFTLTVDKTAPTAAISASIPTSSLNGEKSLSGTVTEDNSPASFTLYYSTSNTNAAVGSEGTIPTSWTKFGDEITTAASIYNWSFADKFDFSSLSGATYAADGTATIYLLPVVYDAAGNCNVHADGKTTADFTQCSKKSVKYSVDQNTDRPVIKLSNLSISNSTLMSKTVIGTISDDDGISDFYYTDNSTSAATFDATDSNWKKITVTDGSWSIDAGSDGSKTWWFYVKDTEGGEFITTSSSALTRAYISDSTTTKADNKSSLDFKVDTSSPVITSLAVYQATSTTVPSATDSNWTTTAGATFGGNNKYLFAKVVVTEAVGMASENPVTLSIGGNAKSATSSPSGTSPTYTYILGPVTVSTISGTGVMSLTATATDNAKLSSSSAININIDNEAPTVNITSPGTTTADYVTSSATIKGIASDAGSSVGSIAWCVPTLAQQASTYEFVDADWTTLTSTSTINISFAWADISKYSDTTSSTGYATATAATDDSLVKIPVYFKTTDAAGNFAIDKTFAFYIDTEASKASATITYPTDSAAVGSSVALYGTASDDVSVSKVMVQLDVDGDGDFDEDDYTAISGWNVYGDNLVATTSDCEWYILATGTNSWKLSVDNSKINYTVESGKLRKLGVRVRAWDGLKNYDGTDHAEGSVHLRSWPTYTSDSTNNEIFVTIDAGAPEIKNLTLVQYSGETKVASVKYESGVYISGKDTTKTWYIEGTVTDDKALDSYSFNAVANSEINVTGTTSGISDSGDTKSATIKQEITTSANGQIYTQLVATDTTGKSNQQYIIVNIDNIAPSIYNTSNDAVTSTTTSVRLKNSSSQTLGDSYVVENSDGSFTFGDTITEGESGLSYLAFYFGRKPLNGDNETRVYCPQYCLTTTGEAYDNKSTYSGSSGTDGSIYMNTDGLACMYVTGSTSVTDGVTTFTPNTKANLIDNHNVRVGGLIKYNGVYKTITAVDWTAGTLAFTSSITASTSATAELIYAQVVDHKGIEINDTYTNIENGDGDGMNEVLKVKGATYTWQASIASDNIPDGPIVIHVVAIDAAGNISKGTISTSIANNRPRIAKALVATDLNGSGYFDYYNTESIKNANKDDDTASGSEFGEFVYYSTLDKATGKEQSLVTVSTSNPFVVKDMLLVLPEFVGGNGVLEYGYSIGDTDVTTPISGTTALASTSSTLKVADKTGTTDNIADYIQATTYDSNLQYGGVVITDNSATTGLGQYESWTTSSKTEKYIALTFWDATEETTQGTNSLWAMLKIPAYINVVDDVKPTAKIEPFHWTSWSDCSTYVDSDGNSQGHIDLEADLNSTKPGVAGTVIVNGTAWDDSRLGSLWMTTPTVADPICVATYSAGTWTKVTTGWPTNWLDFSATDTKAPSQSGHEVSWKFTINMTPYGVASNQAVQVTAKDASSAGVNTSLSSTTQTVSTEQTPYYLMDFVPYIKGISGAYRSRLGRYPVQAGSNMVIEGYNFASSATYAVNFYKTVDGKQGGTAAAYSGTITHTTDGQITITAPQYSCFVEVTVSGTKTQNNSNTNERYNVQAGDYTVGDATPGANYWNDDCYISVWNVSTSIEGSVNPRSGLIKKIDSINSDNGTLYRKKDDGSVSTWTGMTDHHLALWSSDDLQIYGTAQGSAIIKAPTIFANSQAAFAVPIDAVDYTVIKGLPWYVALDNYVGDSSANTWGAGLFIAREGYWWNKTKFNTTNTVSDSEEKQIVEKLGSSTAADKRDSSGGYDSVLSQFQNPRIAGYNNDTETMSDGTSTHTGVDYIYISYYDSYAHCLKYAAYKSGHRTTSVSGKWGTDNDCKDLVPLMRTADNMTKGYSVVAGYDTVVTNDSTFKEEAGEWSDIAVDGTIPVIVYYNKTNGCIEVARGKQIAPSTGNVHTSTGFTSDNTESSTGWTKTKDIKPEGVSDFGRYVSIAMEPSTGNIHVAAQDADNGVLYYLYLTKGTDEKYTISICTPVDKTSSVGRWTDIELTDSTKTGYVAEPVISYIDTACLTTARAMKVAYIDSTATVNGKTVAYWEAMTDPAKYYGYDKRTSVMPDVYEAVGSTIKAKVGVGFNSSMFAIDFLRGEE